MKTIQIILPILFALNVNAQNDTTVLDSKNYLSIELDPAPFLLGGYSVSLKWSPEHTNHFSVMGSLFGSKFPDKMMSKTNYNNGFRDLTIKNSYALFIDYFLKDDRTGLHFGPSVFLYSRSVGLPDNIERTNFKSIYPNLRVGYVYKPFKRSGFYLNPWVNFGKEIVLTNNDFLNKVEYSITGFSYILAVHLGYKVSF